jgi:hypothetical protein
MNMTVAITSTLSLKAVETLDVTGEPFVSNSDNTRTHQVASSRTLGVGTTPPATIVSDFLLTLTAGAATVDLRSLPGTKGIQDGNGKKIRELYIKAVDTNGNLITVVGGAANGYLLFGTAGKETLNPGEELHRRYKDALPAVDDTHKTIDFAGTLAQQLQVVIVLG